MSLFSHCFMDVNATKDVNKHTTAQIQMMAIFTTLLMLVQSILAQNPVHGIFGAVWRVPGPSQLLRKHTFCV